MNGKHTLSKIILLILSSALTFGCIDSSLEHCPKKGELVIRAYDNGGTDISSSGEAGDVILFEYDEKGKFLSRRNIPSSDIISGKTIPLIISKDSGRRFIAWSNIYSESSMLDFSMDRAASDNTVTPERDLSGFSRIAGTIFYGSSQTDFASLGKNPLVEVRIIRAVSRIHVSIIGMEADAKPEEYSIQVVNDDQSHLDFENRVIRRDNLKYRSNVDWLQVGKIMETKNPVVTLPSPAGASKTILLYHNGILIGTATQDTAGLPIAPKPGQKVSVLINLGDLTTGLKIIVGDWEQIVDWKVW